MEIYIYKKCIFRKLYTYTNNKKLDINKLVGFFQCFEKKEEIKHTGTLQSFTPNKSCFSALKKKYRN